MKYLIKLEDRDMNRAVTIVCNEGMTLEELYDRITSALCLCCYGEIGHSFQANGQVYVPLPDVILARWRKRGKKDNHDEQDNGAEVLCSEECRLCDVFTVKESVVLFQQIHSLYRTRVYCTLKDRV